MPQVKTFTSAVPFSAAHQQKEAMRFLFHTMVGQMDINSIHFSFTPKDTYDSLNMWLSMPQKKINFLVAMTLSSKLFKAKNPFFLNSISDDQN